MSTLNHHVVAERLTRDRMASYLEATGGDLLAALELYDWSVRAGAAIYEDLGRLEVIFRNAIDSTLLAYGVAEGWPHPWYRRPQLFPGEAGRRTVEQVAAAERRARRRRHAVVHGRVIEELGFGFWRYLCVPSSVTTLWVPVLASAFPNHPAADDRQQVRADVESRMQRLHFLRNRIAHHKPIHRRDLANDHRDLVELIGWICGDCSAWIRKVTRVPAVLVARPG